MLTKKEESASTLFLFRQQVLSYTVLYEVAEFSG